MTSNLKRLSLAAALAVFSIPALAGGPIGQCTTGQAFVWGGGGASIPYNPDMGPLVVAGDNASAVALVGSAFQVWEDVPTATATYANAGPLPVDVTGANALTYLNEPAPDGLSPVVFDFDDSVKALFGFPPGVLGVAGIAWVNTITCEALEGLAVLFGQAFGGDPAAAFDVTVHEFGHYSGLGHTVVNGQIYLAGDNTGPTPNDTAGPAPSLFTNVIETMYPFYFGSAVGTGTLHRDDAMALSELYPDVSLTTDFATISGSAISGVAPVTGVNVIARNVADPFDDAVSAISGDFSVGADSEVGQWSIQGLTPNADYLVYVDEILAGGFSTPVLSPLPGPEDLWNGASESDDQDIDDPSAFVTVSAGAGGTASGIDIIFNQPGEGDPLAVGDDGFVQLGLPFEFCIAGEPYGSVFVNANGNLTFGAADTDFSESTAEMLNGPPRVAGLWDDLNPAAGGTVSYTTSTAGRGSFTVSYDSVPEFSNSGANSFDITLYNNSRKCVGKSAESDSKFENQKAGNGREVEVNYYAMSATDGLAGVSKGNAVTTTFETEVDVGLPFIHNMKFEPATFEIFTSGDNDLAGDTTLFKWVGTKFSDNKEINDSLPLAAKVQLPFDSLDEQRRYTEIFPAGNDVDYFRFNVNAGDTILAETIAGNIDTVLGLYQCTSKIDDCADGLPLIAGDDDGGSGLLSKIQYTTSTGGTYAIAVSTFPDFDFSGDGFGQGRYVLTIDAVDSFTLSLGDDDSAEVQLPFSFPYQGSNYSSVWVNSNGSLTFGSGDIDFTESVFEFLNDQPRIAGLWVDLNPPQGGSIVVDPEPSDITISFINIPEWFSSGSNTFTFTLLSDGTADVTYGAVSETSGIAGFTEGGGAADPGETNLDSAGSISCTGTTYEQFNFGDPFDLAGGSVTCTP